MALYERTIAEIESPPGDVDLRAGDVDTSAEPAPVWNPDEIRYLNRKGMIAKRALDIVVSLVALIVLLPLMLLIAIVISLWSPGPALFGQKRVGQHGKLFRCWKFRTMYYDAEDRLRDDPELWEKYVANDFKLEVHEDPRVTSFGHFLRKTSLDELPQFFNVLIGNMSLVGPRPVVEDELACYGPWRPAYLAAKPGITGPWQVGGRNDIRYPERARIDSSYVSQWKLRTDFALLLSTVPRVLQGRGVR